MPDQPGDDEGQDLPTTRDVDPPGPGAGRRVVAMGGRWFWLVPAATFLAGVLLTWLVLGAGDADSANNAAGPSPTSTSAGPATSTPGAGGVTVTVPGSCLDVADSSQKVLALVRQAVQAARDLDASALSGIVRDLQAAQSDLQQQSTACQSSASIYSATS